MMILSWQVVKGGFLSKKSNPLAYLILYICIYKFLPYHNLYILLPIDSYSYNYLIVPVSNSCEFYMSKEETIMDKIFHPVSGESGFFCTEQEKLVIDIALENMLYHSSATGRGDSRER